MGRKDTAIQQPQSQEPTAADERAAGLGGSYLIDKSGATTLVHRSEAQPVSRKAPLKRELPDGSFEEVQQLPDGTLVPLNAPAGSEAAAPTSDTAA